MQNVHVRFGLSPRAQTDLAFAADLADRIGGRLFVWTEEDRAARALLGGLTGPDAATREHAHVADRIRLLIKGMGIRLAVESCLGDPRDAVHDPRSIVVGDRDAGRRSAAAALAPKGEKSISARGATEICLPFAGGESALQAAVHALPLARALGMSVVFYHTTWREEGLSSDAPAERHMTEEATAVLLDIRGMADDEGVRHRTVIETAAAIAEGTVRAALNERCALIALARGRHVGRGSYVDQVLERSVIPVLLAGRSAS